MLRGGLNIEDINTHTDFLARIDRLLENAPPIALFFGLMAVVFLLALALFGRRNELLFLLIFTVSLSGAAWTAIDAGSTILRWLILFLLALNCIRLKSSPGPAMMFFLVYVLMGMGMIAFSFQLTWSLQTGGLLIMTTMAAIALGDTLNDRAGFRRLFLIYLIGITVWLGIGLVTLRQIVEASQFGRFGGGIKSVSLFALTGGLMLPIAVWGAFRDGKTFWKLVSAGMVVSIVLLLYASGQRTGTYAGFLGCVPMLIRKQRASTVLVVGACGIVVVGFAGLLATANEQEFKLRAERFTSFSLTGRGDIWRDAVHECSKHPIIGRGHGSDRHFSITYRRPMHNMYLATWYQTGIFGLVVFLLANGVGCWQAIKLMIKGHDREIRDFARVILGLLIAGMAMGMFETQSSPSNFSTITLTLMLVAIGRLTALSAQENAARQRAPVAARPRQIVWVPRELLERSQYGAPFPRNR